MKSGNPLKPFKHFTVNAVLAANAGLQWMLCGLPSNQNSALVKLVDHRAKSGAAAAANSYPRSILETRKIDFLPRCTSGSALHLRVYR